MKQIVIVVALSLLAAACGVKNDLVKPNGQTTRDEPDPSKPPFPLGR